MIDAEQQPQGPDRGPDPGHRRRSSSRSRSALCVDRAALAAAQEGDDPALAAEILHAAYRTDVRPLVAEARRRNGAALDPLTAYRRSGYREAVIGARGSGHVATGL